MATRKELDAVEQLARFTWIPYQGTRWVESDSPLSVWFENEVASRHEAARRHLQTPVDPCTGCWVTFATTAAQVEWEALVVAAMEERGLTGNGGRSREMHSDIMYTVDRFLRSGGVGSGGG